MSFVKVSNQWLKHQGSIFVCVVIQNGEQRVEDVLKKLEEKKQKIDVNYIKQTLKSVIF